MSDAGLPGFVAVSIQDHEPDTEVIKTDENSKPPLDDKPNFPPKKEIERGDYGLDTQSNYVKTLSYLS